MTSLIALMLPRTKEEINTKQSAMSVGIDVGMQASAEPLNFAHVVDIPLWSVGTMSERSKHEADSGGDEQYGICDKCGYEAPDFESARVHTRDRHNLLGTSTGMSGLFDNE